MDKPGEPMPTEKRCSLINGRKRPLECIREFQLQRQFPSTVKQALKNDINSELFMNIKYASDAKVSSNVKNGVPHNLQKLRLLSPNGRDLGEFDVELKSADPSKRNTIIISKSKSKPVDKPLTLPLSPVSHKVLPRILRQNRKGNLVKEICSRRISCSDISSVSQQQQSIILPMNRMPSNDEEGKMEKQTSNNIYLYIPFTDEISSKHSVCQTVDSTNQKYVYHGVGDIGIHNRTKVQGTEHNKISIMEPLYKENVESSCPSNCKKLINSSDKNSISLSGKNLKVSKGKCIVTIKNTENGKIIMSLKSAANVKPKYNQIDKNLNQNGLCNSRKNFSNGEVSYKNNFFDKNNSLQTKPDVAPKSQVPEIKTNNVMTIIPNKTLSFNQNAVLAQESNTPVASASNKNIMDVTEHGTIRHDTKCDNTQSKGLKIENNDRNDNLVVIDDRVRRIPEPQRIADMNVQSNVQNKNLPQNDDDLSDRLNIIKKAMDSVKDNELRELALKALSDCGIGIERYIPIRPPENHKIVHDTQVQTLVFGLLDPKSFILINKDLKDIPRINQITLHDMPEENLFADNLHSNNNFNLSKDLDNVIEQGESPFDLDNFMEQFFKENSNAFKMKETLSKTRVRCNSILEHLQRDFEHIKRYDQKGMLNIHNAVLSDNVYLVRRQLMVLEHCKQSVDILTKDGMVILFPFSNLLFNFI